MKIVSKNMTQWICDNRRDVMRKCVVCKVRVQSVSLQDIALISCQNNEIGIDVHKSVQHFQSLQQSKNMRIIRAKTAALLCVLEFIISLMYTVRTIQMHEQTFIIFCPMLVMHIFRNYSQNYCFLKDYKVLQRLHFFLSGSINNNLSLWKIIHNFPSLFSS